MTSSRIRKVPFHLPKYRRRDGAVLVEFAFVLPVILFSFACMLEISRVLLLQHTADTAAYEGARCAMVPGSSATDAINASNDLLTAAGLQKTVVTVTPEVIEESTSVVTVVVEIPVASNYWIAPFLLKDFTVKSEVALFCERPPVVQLTGVPAMKIKGAKGKSGGKGL